MDSDEFSLELAPEEPEQTVEDFGTTSANSHSEEAPLTLELEEPSQPKEASTRCSPASATKNSNSGLALELDTPTVTPEASPPLPRNSEEPRSPFAPSSSQKASSEPVQPKVTTPATAEIVIYDDATNNAGRRLFISALIFGLIGSLLFAGTSAIYFSIGRRVGILFVAFFAALGVRMGSDRCGQRQRWYAAFTAGASAIFGKALLVFILFSMYPNFSAEDWTNFADPGKSSAIYFEQGVMNALDTGGNDKRGSQERLDDRFEKEFTDENSDDYAEYDDEEYDEKTENKRLEFSEVFPKLFDVVDLPLIILCMFGAFKFAKNGS